MKKFLAIILSILLLNCTSLKKEDEVSAAKKSVEEYLSSKKGIDLNNVEIEYSEVSQKDNQIDLVAKISLKENKEQFFKYKYVLNRKDGKWVVDKSEPLGIPHSSKPPTPTIPPNHPPIGNSDEEKEK